ncbi:hypothetical protein AMAG_19520 [Allomyces macrogynus ATCC 38327]|uniref:Uncharacterized protein n=1 Tax=Allomyces macrogynus (strain ATCC 38327) TaxID=578462 RepID=A0A0L0SWF6_ALLM3|nr:hypothetical protein AMAG_19520 [Allomyces macrogynus ATCC 38327]|eukprot:KNE66806.1 hypothetical protein AMAG_19520 [Allomyces macrogynus ATCC 38327]
MALKGGKLGGLAGSFGVSERDMAMQAALLNSYDDLDVGCSCCCEPKRHPRC